MDKFKQRDGEKNKKYDVNPDLKTILNEGKTSTFSLTNLFDSKNFQTDEDNENNHLNDYQNGENELNWKKRKVDKIFESVDESYVSKSEFESKNKFESKNEFEFKQTANEERFFFDVDDERFERLKFYDLNKIEKHNQDWNKKREQILQALSRRRKLIKKKESNDKNKFNSKSNKQQNSFKQNKKFKKSQAENN